MIKQVLTSVVFLGAICGCASTPPVRTDQTTHASSDLGRFVADQERWTFQGDPGWAYHTPNSVIRTTSSDRKIIERLPPFVELSILHYQRALTRLPRPADTIETYFFDHRMQWESMTRLLMREKASVYLSIERGGYSARHIGVFYDIGPKDSFTICAHEGWHQYAHSTFVDPLPVWLDEGVACYMEGFKWDDQFPDHPRFLPWANLERFDQLRDAHNSGSLLSIHSLLTQRPQDLITQSSSEPLALNYYAQVWALIQFLNHGEQRRYRSALHSILEDASIGSYKSSLSPSTLKSLNIRRTGPGTLTEYLPEDITLRELDEQYQRFIAQVVRVGSRNKILMGQSPINQ